MFESSRHTPCAVGIRLVSQRHTECAYYFGKKTEEFRMRTPWVVAIAVALVGVGVANAQPAPLPPPAEKTLPTGPSIPLIPSTSPGSAVPQTAAPQNPLPPFLPVPKPPQSPLAE